MVLENQLYFGNSQLFPLVDLYLIFEKSSFKNQIEFDELNFLSILHLIFEGYTGSENQVSDGIKIQFVELDFSNLTFQKLSADQ